MLPSKPFRIDPVTIADQYAQLLTIETPAPQVDTFLAAGTWTKPAGAVEVRVVCIGGGGGGGSGNRGAAGTVRSGGAGGGGAGRTEATFMASELPDSVPVSVGSGGSGGAAITTDSTVGLGGSAGTNTFFGGTSSGYFVAALNGGPGSGGATSASTGGYAGVGTSIGATGGPGSHAGAGGGGGQSSTSGQAGGGGGGGGGGISSANVPSSGGVSWDSRSVSARSSAGGVVDGVLPSSGVLPTARFLAGPGGAGGASSITQASQSGAPALGYGAGGGGGGASVNGFNSGAGGNGGPGVCWVITYFSKQSNVPSRLDPALAAQMFAAPLASGNYYFTMPSTQSNSTGMGFGNLRLSPFDVPVYTTLSRVGLEVITAGEVGCKIRLGIYSDNGGYPANLIADWGTINGDSATVQEIVISTSLAPGRYWIGGALQGPGVTQPNVRISANAMVPAASLGQSIPTPSMSAYGYTMPGATGALPTTWSGTAIAGLVYRTFVKVA